MNSIPPFQVHYAGFWLRFLASLIDTVLWLAILLALLSFISPLTYTALITVNTNPTQSFLSWTIPIIATLIFWHFGSATPGKMLLRLKIVDATSLQQPTTKQFIARYIGYYVSALPLGLGFIWIAFDKRKQGWHDKIANTVVIHEN